MNPEPLKPVADRPKRKARKARPKGRPADLLACLIAALCAVLAAFGSLHFFLGFAANDSVLAGLVSAFAFSVLLGAFAVVPAVIISFIAWRGWKVGMTRKNTLWCICLTVPWVVLSILILLNTPLPKLLSGGALLLSTLLFLWAFITLILSFRRNPRPS